jgi:hypothetical protein
MPTPSVATVVGRGDGFGKNPFHGSTVALEFGSEEYAICVRECKGIDGIFELCWKRAEREDLPLGKRLACGSLGTSLELLGK